MQHEDPHRIAISFDANYQSIVDRIDEMVTLINNSSTMTPEERLLSAKLEANRESIIGIKHVTDTLLDRVDKADTELNNMRVTIGRFENNSIRIDERIANIERYIDAMRGDIRSVRNAVVGSIIAATFIGIAGLAVTGLSVQKHQHNNAPAIAGKTV